ncbi:MAG TPA: hypothetical protein VJ302_24490 [Blastocatellia bacterium]|nr:hypothetical protein [Blastocatellia bacterium]
MEQPKNDQRRPAIRFKRFFLRPQPADQAASAPAPQSAAPPRRKLSDAEERKLRERLWPILRCDPVPERSESWSFYYTDVRFRQPGANKKLLVLIDLLINSVASQRTLHPYTVFDQSYVYPNLVKVFASRSAAFMAMPAIGVNPEHGPPRFPTKEDMEALDQQQLAAITDEKKEGTTLQDFFSDLPAGAYWIKQNHALARELLFGEGGWGFILSPLEETPFLEKTKALLLEGVEDEALKSMPFVMPFLRMDYFLNEIPRRLHRWFEILDLYLGESPKDGGLVIASRACLDELLVELVDQSELKLQGTIKSR